MMIFDNGKWRVSLDWVGSGSRLKVESLLNGFCDWPIRYEDGHVVWDFPQRVPKYVKRICNRVLLKPLPKIEPLKRPVDRR